MPTGIPGRRSPMPLGPAAGHGPPGAAAAHWRWGAGRAQAGLGEGWGAHLPRPVQQALAAGRRHTATGAGFIAEWQTLGMPGHTGTKPWHAWPPKLANAVPAAISIPLPALTAVVSQRVVPRLCVCPVPAAAAGLARLALPCSSGGGCSRRCRLAALQNAAQALPAGRGSATASVCYSVVGLRPRGRYGRPRARQVASPAQSLAPKCSTLG